MLNIHTQNTGRLHLELYYFGLSVLVYLFIVRVFSPSGYSLENWIAVFFMLCSAFFLFRLPLKTLFLKKSNAFPESVKWVFIAYLMYVVITLFRDFSLNAGDLRTLFSNEYTVLAALVPLSFFWGFIQKDKAAIYKSLYSLNRAGVVLGVILLFFSAEAAALASPLLWLSFPLIFLIREFKWSQKLIIYASLGITIYVALQLDQRSVYLKAVVLLLLSLLVNSRYLFQAGKRILIVTAVVFGIAGVTFTYTTSFETVLSGLSEVAESSEAVNTSNTRDFLILEFFADISNTELLVGKGFLGTYYSPFFFQIRGQDTGDYYQRFTNEIGVLTIILKGGILFGLIYVFFFFSMIRNLLRLQISRISLALSLYVIVEWLFMFIINNPSYSLRNIVIWGLIGVVYSYKGSE